MTVKGLRIKINKQGVRDLLLSDEVQNDIAARGRRIAAAAGDGFEMDLTENRDRVVAFVRTDTYEAKKAEATDRTLTRAISAGR